MSEPIKDYLGDGLYVEWDGFQYTLSTERQEGVHYVALDPHVLQAFQRFVARMEPIKPSS